MQIGWQAAGRQHRRHEGRGGDAAKETIERVRHRQHDRGFGRSPGHLGLQGIHDPDVLLVRLPFHSEGDQEYPAPDRVRLAAQDDAHGVPGLGPVQGFAELGTGGHQLQVFAHAKLRDGMLAHDFRNMGARRIVTLPDGAVNRSGAVPRPMEAVPDICLPGNHARLDPAPAPNGPCSASPTTLPGRVRNVPLSGLPRPGGAGLHDGHHGIPDALAFRLEFGVDLRIRVPDEVEPGDVPV